jgi:hypothetical protein
MKRTLLAAALAALFAPAGMNLLAAEPVDPPLPNSHYTINDAGYVRGQTAAIKTDFDARSSVVPAAATSDLGTSDYNASDFEASKTSRFAGAIRTPATKTAYKASANNTNTAATTNSVAANAANGCDDCCDCDDCGWGPNLWFAEGEGLLWWRKSRSLPPLVTTSLPGTTQANAGVVGLGTTQVLFGGNNVSDSPTGGGRIWFGRWLNEDKCIGVAADFFALAGDDVNYSRVASGTETLAIPFYSVGQPTPAENALLLNFFGPPLAVSQNGRVDITAQNDILGADFYLRKLMWAESNFRVDFLGGYQFSRIDDALRLHANYDDIQGIPNSNFDLTDTFNAKNEFHGGVLGVLVLADYGRWRVKGIAKCGLGNMHQTVDISGQTVNVPVGGGGPTTTPGGLFTQRTNIGSYSNDEFGIIPEAKLNLGYRLNRNWTAGVGYSFIYWNDVMTAGRAIDRSVNLTQVPGPLVGDARPTAPTFFNTTDYWAQGVNFSLEFAY